MTVPFPRRIGWEHLGDSIPVNVLCYVCYEPLFRAVNTACQHHLCCACSTRFMESNRSCCGLCRHPINTEQDSEVGRRVTAYVRSSILSKAALLFHSQFPSLPESAFQLHAPRFMDRHTLRLEFALLLEAVRSTRKTLCWCSEELQDSDIDYPHTVSYTSLQEFIAAPSNEEVLACEVEGPWLTDVKVLSKFSRVREVRLFGCANLLSLSHIGCLASLTHLIVEECGVVTAQAIEQCSQLRRVEFTRCPHLTGFALPQLPQNAAAHEADRLPLGVVRVTECPLFEIVAAAPCSLPLNEFSAHKTSFSELSALRLCVTLQHLDVSGCSRLTEIAILCELQQLTCVDVSDTAVPTPLATLSQLPLLAELRMNGCSVQGDFRELAGAGVNLKVIEAARTALTSVDGISACVLLEKVDISHCALLKDLSALANLPHLKWVNASFTPVSDISPLNSFGTLEEVHLGGCKELTDLSPWANFQQARSLQILDLHESGVRDVAVWLQCPPNLQTLDLGGCTELRDICVLESACSLEVLILDGSGATDLSPLSTCAPSLKELHIFGCEVRNIDVLQSAAQLAVLDLDNTLVEDLTPLQRCAASLNELHLHNWRTRDIAVLETAERLERLNLSGTQVTDLGPLAKCARTLKHLSLASTRVSDISVLQDAENLEILDLENTQVLDLTPLAMCLPTLTELYLSYWKLGTISALHSAERLEKLCLSGTQVACLSPLANCAPALKELRISNCKVSDIAVLRRAERLEVLDLQNTQVGDLSPLAGCIHTLRELRLFNCPVGDIAVLRRAVRLEILNLYSTPVEDFSPLVTCAPTLKRLSLFNCRVRDICVLSEAERLELLDLQGTQVDDLAPLAKCVPALKKLYLNKCKVGDLSVLRGANALEFVDVRGTCVTDFSPLPPLVTVMQ